MTERDPEGLMPGVTGVEDESQVQERMQFPGDGGDIEVGDPQDRPDPASESAAEITRGFGLGEPGGAAAVVGISALDDDAGMDDEPA